MKEKILFVCKHNRFRSKVAEAYFNKINKNENLMAESAGIFQGRPISPYTKKAARELEIILKGQPRAISTKLLSKINMIIIVADNVSKKIFYYGDKCPQKLIVWKISDASIYNKKEIQRSIKKIIKKIDTFVRDRK
jgi:protein-tyrosine-phosphatase